MPQIKDPRRERFAIFLAKGDTQVDAYRKAGYSAAGARVKANASHAARHPEIVSRVAELKAGQADRLGVTVEILLTELEEARLQAIRQKNPSAAATAVMAKAKLLGLIVGPETAEAHVVKPMREPGEAPKQMTVAEWEARFVPKTPEPEQ